MAKKYNSKETVEKILSAASKLFLEKGFDKTSMQDIVATAGISKGAIYHHFQSKEEIMAAVTEKQAQLIKATMENWLSDTKSLKGKDKLTAILEKNLASQEAHSLDDVMSARIKSAEFVLNYMQGCVNNDAAFISAIIKEGNEDGSLNIAYPDECAEVFLLLLNIWCDPVVFECDALKLILRLRFLQHMMKSLGMDVLSDDILDKTIKLMQGLYLKENK